MWWEQSLFFNFCVGSVHLWVFFGAIFPVYAASSELAPSNVRALRDFGILAVSVYFTGFRQTRSLRYVIRVLNVSKEYRSMLAIVYPYGHVVSVHVFSGKRSETRNLFPCSVRFLYNTVRRYEFRRVPFYSSPVATA